MPALVCSAVFGRMCSAGSPPGRAGLQRARARPATSEASPLPLPLLQLVLLAWAALLQPSGAYPESWMGCGHPDQVMRPHGDIRHTSDIEFTLMDGDSDGAPVTEYEPGKEYTLEIKPHKRSEGLLTASIGDLAGMGSDTSHNWRSSCDNLRVDFGSRRSMFYVTWTAPSADEPQSQHAVEFKVTFSDTSVGDFNWNSLLIQPAVKPLTASAMMDPGAIVGLPVGLPAVLGSEPQGLSKYGTCTVDEAGKQVCETVCGEVKVVQQKDGLLKMRCVLPEDNLK